MNLILLEPSDFIDDNTVKLSSDRHLHVQKVLKSHVGDTVKVGLLNHNLGEALIEDIAKDSTVIKILPLNIKPPTPHPAKLVLAMQRPKMLKRMLRTISQLGVKEIHLINSYHVEKSYWETDLFKDQKFNVYFKQGLEQASDTLLPTLSMHKLFKPFIEDTAPSLIKESPGVVFHPYSPNEFTATKDKPAYIFIGPERGFTDFEVDMIEKAGARSVRLGSRALRSEVFLPVALGQFL